MIIKIAFFIATISSVTAQSLGTQDTSINWTDFRWNSIIGSTYNTSSIGNGYGNLGTFDLGSLDSSLAGIDVTIDISTTHPNASLFLGGASGSYRVGFSEIVLTFSQPVDLRREHLNGGVAFSTGESETYNSNTGISYMEWTDNNITANLGTGTFQAGGSTSVQRISAETYGTTMFSMSWDDTINPSTQNFRVEIGLPIPEPTSISFLGLGGIALLGFRKRA